MECVLIFLVLLAQRKPREFSRNDKSLLSLHSFIHLRLLTGHSHLIVIDSITELTVRLISFFAEAANTSSKRRIKGTEACIVRSIKY